MKIFGVAVQTGAQFYGVSSGIKEGVRTYTHTQTSVRWDSVESITQIFFKTFAQSQNACFLPVKSGLGDVLMINTLGQRISATI